MTNGDNQENFNFSSRGDLNQQLSTNFILKLIFPSFFSDMLRSKKAEKQVIWFIFLGMKDAPGKKHRLAGNADRINSYVSPRFDGYTFYQLLHHESHYFCYMYSNSRAKTRPIEINHYQIIKSLMSVRVVLRSGVKRRTMTSCHSRHHVTSSRYDKCPVFVWFRILMFKHTFKKV